MAPYERHLRPPAPASTYDFRNAADALSWLDTERAGILAAVDTAPDAYICRLSATIWRYLDTGGHYTLGLRLHSRARLAARAEGEPVAEAIATAALSLAEFRLGRHERAMYHARIAARVGDPGIRGLMTVHLAESAM